MAFLVRKVASFKNLASCTFYLGTVSLWFALVDALGSFDQNILTHFSPVSRFYIPLKTSVNQKFSDVSGDVEMWHRTKMG